MKKILGLDLGTNSIGWAVVNEAENPDEHSSIIKLGVRANPLTVDEQRNFESGKPVMDEAGKTIPSDFVSTSNNHHVAIYQDTDGNLQEQIVSFYDAVCRINLGLPVIDREYKKDEGWKFLVTMKQNEYFVFPNPETGFNPHDIDLMNPDNYALISPNLYRVQAIATKDYIFRHHLETNVNKIPELRNVTWKRITMINKLKDIVKVRINHIGQIVYVGEY